MRKSERKKEDTLRIRILYTGAILLLGFLSVAGVLVTQLMLEEDWWNQASKESLRLEYYSTINQENAHKVLEQYLLTKHEQGAKKSVPKGVEGDVGNYRFAIYYHDKMVYSNIKNVDTQKNTYWQEFTGNVLYKAGYYGCEEKWYIKEIKSGYTVYGGPAKKLTIHDEYKKVGMVLTLYSMRFMFLPLAAVCFFAALILFISLMHKVEEEGAFEHIDLDVHVILLFALCILEIVVLSISDYAFYEYMDNAILFAIIEIGIFFIIDYIYAMRLCMSVSIRVKHQNFLKSFLCVRMAKGIGSFLAAVFGSIPFIWKALMGIGIILLADMRITSQLDWKPGTVLLEKMVLGFGILIILMNLDRLQKRAKALAEGDVDQKVDTRYMLPSFRRHGEYLNAIQEGMQRAVGEKVKSERFKTELITNVSHDIKTPLTSIINYVDLLSREELQNEKAEEYLEVLNRQSTKLKKLIEDLIEASKASTGNIKLDLQPCQADVLLTQTVGEYEEKLRADGLELLLKRPKENVTIQADGRYLWRVFDNLLSNIHKYAQPGTRVYLNLEITKDTAKIVFRNTSRASLNISAAELMERFVRGDASRHTEGSGLGLSIAKNLTEMMHGIFSLEIDGDLFKVTLQFPR